MPKMPLTKNSLSRDRVRGRRGESLGVDKSFSCDHLLWIGDSDHFQMHVPWRICRSYCDSVSYRGNLTEAMESPPRQLPTHVIVAQTNRHDWDQAVMDGPMLSLLRVKIPAPRMLALRGSLVAPTVRLPPVQPGPASETGWVDSVSADEAIEYLPHWFQSKEDSKRLKDSSLNDSCQNPLLPIAIVASRYAVAEPLIDSLTILETAAGERPPLIQWQRELTHRSSPGFGTILWDESEATPATTAEKWRERTGRAPHARHVWQSALASGQQRQLAWESGIDVVLEKPTRLPCLLGSLQRGHL